MNRQEKINYLADVFEKVGVTAHMAKAAAQDVLDHIFPPLEPVDRDEGYNRSYIPVPGGYEIQTKGRGSTFRIVDDDDDHMPMSGSRLEHEFLEEMAYRMRTWYGV